MIKQFEDQLNKIKSSFLYSIQIVNLNQATHPFMPLTFSLWRKQKFCNFIKQIHPEVQHNAMLEFHKQIDYEILDIYKQKLKKATKNCIEQFRISQIIQLKQIYKNGDDLQLLDEYFLQICDHLVQIQMIHDLISFPYAIKTNDLQLRNKFQITQENQNSKISNFISKIGQKSIFSGLTKIGTQVWRKVAIGFTTVAGGLNLVSILGGLAIGQLFSMMSQKYDFSKKKQKIKSEIMRFRENKKILNENYVCCKMLIKKYLQQRQEVNKLSIENEFKKKIEQIYINNTRRLLIKQEQNGWIQVDINKIQQQFFIKQLTQQQAQIILLSDDDDQ